MEKILAKRYAFCDFSDIAGFPHPVPTINEWDDYLPRFRGSKYDHPGEHLFNFHQCMLEHGFVHEDVLIKLFKFSLEGNAREWCQSLPAVSIHSLKDFHVAFNSYYEKIYSADLLFLECCHEFNLSKVDIHEDYAAVENTLHYDQEIVYPHHDSHSDAFVIASNASPNLCCHEDKIVPIENLKSEEHIFISASDSFRSTEIEEDSLQFPNLQGLSNLQLRHENHDQKWVDAVINNCHGSFDPNNSEDLNLGCVDAADVEGSSHFLDLQTKEVRSRYEEKGEDLNGPDQ